MIPAFFVFIFSVFLTNCCVIHGKLTDIVVFISFLVLFFCIDCQFWLSL